LVLEAAGILDIKKGYVGRRPGTFFRISDQGREAFVNYR
jgi:hypothetical protein